MDNSSQQSTLLTPSVSGLLVVILMLEATTTSTTISAVATPTAATSAVRTVLALMPLPATIVTNARNLLAIRVKRWRLARLLYTHRCLKELPVHDPRAATRQVAEITTFVADVVAVKPHLSTPFLAHLVVHTLSNGLTVMHVHLDVHSAALCP
jgi:hypothetical protein